MNKEELIGKLHMIYAGDRNALEEMVGYYDGLKECIEIVQQENQELKNQIVELNLQNFNLREDIMIKKISFPSKEIKDKTFYDLYDMPTYEELEKQNEEYKRLGFKHLNDKCNELENQQKEFISYLENEIKRLEENNIYEPLQRTALATHKHNLSKFKEIIGKDINVRSKGAKDENI